jgi:D-alanyl-D-alanine carboxypeptidase (penicillin-binding protein 5/6)
MVAPFQLDELQAQADEAKAAKVSPSFSRRERRRLATAATAVEAAELPTAAPMEVVVAAPIAPTAPPSAPPVELDPTPPPQSRRERRLESEGRPVRRHIGGRVIALLVAAIVVIFGVFAGIRLSAAVPNAVVTSIGHRSVVVPSSTVSLPWPAMGEAAIAVPSIGIDVTSGAEPSVPIASLTKMMTAYVVLHDHPLAKGASGPNITITQADVDDYDGDTTQDEANAEVTLGEVLTERQVLGGMLVHSANNLADALAMWDAGTIPAFVAKMNKTAAQLGMDHTHYADPSGFNMESQSTAGDLLKVAAPDMTNATFASLVQMPSITLPVAGTISTYTPLLGFDGVIGVKSGFTTVAGGCDVLATVRRAHGLPVLILTAVTGQQGPNVLVEAGTAALALANAVGPAIGAVTVVHRGEVVAHVTSEGHTVNATAQSSASVLSWPGVTATRMLKAAKPIVPGATRGTHVGSMVVALGTQHVVIPVKLTQPIPKATLTQRLF